MRQTLHAVGASWGDFDNDGDLDLFVAAYVDGVESYSRAHLFRNAGGKFVDVAGEGQSVPRCGSRGPVGGLRSRRRPRLLIDRYVSRRRPPSPAPQRTAGRRRQRSSLQVRVLDRAGRATRNGAEVRLYAAEGKLLGRGSFRPAMAMVRRASRPRILGSREPTCRRGGHVPDAQGPNRETPQGY